MTEFLQKSESVVVSKVLKLNQSSLSITTTLPSTTLQLLSVSVHNFSQMLYFRLDALKRKLNYFQFLFIISPINWQHGSNAVVQGHIEPCVSVQTRSESHLQQLSQQKSMKTNNRGNYRVRQNKVAPLSFLLFSQQLLEILL